MRGRSLGRRRLCGGIVAGIVGECGDVALLLDEDGDAFAEGHVLGALRVEQLGDVALLLHLEVDGGLVGFDAGEHVARGHLVADLEVPRADVALSSWCAK